MARSRRLSKLQVAPERRALATTEAGVAVAVCAGQHCTYHVLPHQGIALRGGNAAAEAGHCTGQHRARAVSEAVHMGMSSAAAAANFCCRRLSCSPWPFHWQLLNNCFSPV